jgi:hypothetical protein
VLLRTTRRARARRAPAALHPRGERALADAGPPAWHRDACWEHGGASTRAAVLAPRSRAVDAVSRERESTRALLPVAWTWRQRRGRFVREARSRAVDHATPLQCR